MAHALPALLLAALTLGCVPRAKEIAPPVDPGAPSVRDGLAVDARWWTALGDPRLDALIQDALADNLDLLSTLERLEAARALARRERGGLWPALQGDITGRRSLPDRTDSLELSLSASFEIDLWGRIRSAAQAASYRADAAEADWQTAALSLSSEVALAWFAVLEAQARLVLLASQVETNEGAVRSLEVRYSAGQVARVDVMRQEQALEATRMLVISAQADRDVARQQLAVLLGRSPTDPPAVSGVELPALPPRPAVTADLLQRRPDVQQAYADLLAADRDWATAVAERYPRLTLSASGSTTALFSDWLADLAAALVVPVLEGGSLRAEVRRTEALRQQQLYAYGQQTLDALLEVESALTREAEQRGRVESLTHQAELAEEIHRRLRRDYLSGATDYLDVLVALSTEQRLRRELLSARRTALELRVALYRSLAGGIPAPEVP